MPVAAPDLTADLDGIEKYRHALASGRDYCDLLVQLGSHLVRLQWAIIINGHPF